MLTKTRKEISDRKAARYSQIGRERELWVENVLRASGRFDRVTRHQPHSEADSEGKDFTVTTGNQLASFGVSISQRSVDRSKQLHPSIPQIHVPFAMKPETLVNRVAELLEASK